MGSELGFVAGSGRVLVDRRQRCAVRRQHARVVMLLGRGGEKKVRVEVPNAEEAQFSKEKLVEVQASPQVRPEKAPFWSNVPVGKVFFALSMASLVVSVVRGISGAGKGAKQKDKSGQGASSPFASRAPTSAVATTISPTNTGSAATGWAGPRATPQKHVFESQAKDLLQDRDKKYILVGGKGGVGKTSMSAALATKFADSGQSTLIISTDPAHSLSDSFATDLSGGMPTPVLGIENLYAQEVNPEDIKSQISLLSDEEKRAMMPGMMGDMGLDDLGGLFETLPPGFDEAVALVEIIKLIQGDPAYQRFDRIVFDTAPTGHTLRLLALPDFMNSFLGKIISMKAKFGNMMNQMKNMFGGDGGDGLDTKEIDEMKKSMQIVRDLFKDDRQTEFIVATIPNMMAIAESMRLIDELRKETIPVHYVFVNQIQPENDHCAFCSTRRKEQQANLTYVEKTFAGMKLSKVQFFDREIRGSHALRAMGGQLFQTEEEAKAALAQEKEPASAVRTAAPVTDGNGASSSNTSADTNATTETNVVPSQVDP